MKIFILLLLAITVLFSDVYYSKVEPYRTKKISSNVLGLVTFIDEDMLGKKLSEKPYIQIDAVLDVKELSAIKNKLVDFKHTLLLNKKILKNLDKLLIKKRENYEKIKILKIKSTLEKNKEFYDLISSENLYLSTQKEVNNLKIQITDLELKEAQLIRNINDKNLSDKGFILYSLDVKVGQVVNKGTLLATVVDTSRAILTIYLNDRDALRAKEKIIYINDKKSKYKIDRLLNIADSKNISKYMAQIIIKAPKLFSKLVKIELKSGINEK